MNSGNANDEAISNPLSIQPTDFDTVFAYHDRTKHHFRQYARSPGYLDWATQPFPFRKYEGSLQLQLDLRRMPRPLAYDQLYETNSLLPEPLNLDSLADFFRYSLALSAWKQSGSSRWSLRINPSSGNLHPTEAYALLPSLSSGSADASLYHYVSESHGLEQRASFSDVVWHQLTDSLPAGSFLVGLSSVMWREAWKYGERAFRYCQHDIGHAIAALRFSAALCGWTLCLVSSWSTEDISRLLGLERAEDFIADEAEVAEVLAIVATTREPPINQLRFPSPLEDMLEQIAGAKWYGRANRLSPAHVRWPIMDEVALATRMPRLAEPASGVVFGHGVMNQTSQQPKKNSDPLHFESAAPTHESPSLDARQIIFQRRSCLALDGVSTISCATFFRMLARTLPTSNPPWDALYWRARIHLVLFVHRVVGLRPGVYVLIRDEAKTEDVKSEFRSEFAWQKPSGTPTELPLYLLLEADCRGAARRLSCDQEIAADGFFSLGMLAEFADSIRSQGAWFYRSLFWEAGVIGQVLYLEAEAAGARSTGIGCFFDDPVHDVLGLRNNRFQSLYHFTVGMPVEDPRLQSWPAYPEALTALR